MQTVVGAIVVAEGRVLAARRSRPPALAGCWEFPGGKVEAGENAEAALVREVREELGIDLALGPELPAEEGGAWPIDDRYSLRLFLASIRWGEPRAGEDHDALRWLWPAELGDVAWLPADRAALPALRRRLSAMRG